MKTIITILLLSFTFTSCCKKGEPLPLKTTLIKVLLKDGQERAIRVECTSELELWIGNLIYHPSKEHCICTQVKLVDGISYFSIINEEEYKHINNIPAEVNVTPDPETETEPIVIP
jgi:hypothetical protein